MAYGSGAQDYADDDDQGDQRIFNRGDRPALTPEGQITEPDISALNTLPTTA